MFLRILTTWTICILLPVTVSALGVGAAHGNIEVQGPKTMYEAVEKKCPNLDATELKGNEILTKRCTNWAEIDATSFFNTTTKTNVECLVFYEAVVSFCTEMGDILGKVQGLIPTTSQLKNYNYDIHSVCAGQSNLYPINKTDHNISSLIRNTNECFLLCLDFSESQITDICKFAYYFANFNVSKFTYDLKTKVVHQSPSHSVGSKLVNALVPAQRNSTASASNTTNQAPHVPLNQGAGATDVKAAAPVQADKPEHTENDHLDHIQHELHQDSPVVESSQVKPEAPVLPGTKDIVHVAPSGKNDSSGNIIKEPPQDSLPQLQVDANTDAKKSPPETVPEKKKKPQIKVPPDVEDYGNEDKSQVVIDDGPNQEMLDDDTELEQEDGDIKPEPVLPDESENKKPKVPSKNVKPSTVEDEAISNLNTPEDDMDGDSYFFSYFTVIMCLFIVGYVGYHNRQKVLALILEGKKGRKTGRGRRPNSANYHKLDTNLEEAISSSCTKSPSNVIY